MLKSSEITVKHIGALFSMAITHNASVKVEKYHIHMTSWREVLNKIIVYTRLCRSSAMYSICEMMLCRHS